jgi:hypothetical protein
MEACNGDPITHAVPPSARRPVTSSDCLPLPETRLNEDVLSPGFCDGSVLVLGGRVRLGDGRLSGLI